ncbi:hypothetical protein K435DRAFT_162885 [Dendrothele bispora CBS 962.96]|uniref:CFEM domain-containing protein n=1 Tax=Dendrothele bispora (strain CBS 962.96) TaxID=1314807 RepID=A0A4V4HFC5_DENBC|nr:hypothetical protein K435DRAFT_162885 [Dendrothele bispora CBS 962.96]
MFQSTTLPFTIVILSLSFLLHQVVPGVHAQASQAPPTTFGTATGSSSVSGSVTGTAISGSITSSAASSTSTNATSTVSTSSGLPNLGGFSECVSTCFLTAVSQANCSNVVPADCYCNNTNYTTSLLTCIRSGCPTELSTAESLTNQFCAIASTSMSFSITAFPSSSSSLSSGSSANATQTSPATSTGSQTSAASGGGDGSGNSAIGMMVLGSGMMGGWVMALVGVIMGGLMVL